MEILNAGKEGAIFIISEYELLLIINNIQNFQSNQTPQQIIDTLKKEN